MTPKILFTILLSGVVYASTSASRAAQSEAPHEKCTQQSSHPEASHSGHESMMNRGEKRMGFSQTTTTHHFLLKPDGGVIAVSANDQKDAATRDQIRMHLAHIAKAFAEGDFDIPMFVHDQTPPGVPVMKRLAKEIHYQSHSTERGGEVTITSASPESIQAIHDFLVFQTASTKPAIRQPCHSFLKPTFHPRTFVYLRALRGSSFLLFSAPHWRKRIRDLPPTARPDMFQRT